MTHFVRRLVIILAVVPGLVGAQSVMASAERRPTSSQRPPIPDDMFGPDDFDADEMKRPTSTPRSDHSVPGQSSNPGDVPKPNPGQPLAAKSDDVATQINDRLDKMPSAGDVVAEDRPPGGGYSPADSVELVNERAESSTVFANPDGSKTHRLATEPIHWKDESGKWQNIDVSLTQGRDGIIRSGANSFVAAFDPKTPGYYLTRNGQTLAFTPTGGQKTEGRVEGLTVTYPEVWPGADLRYTLTSSGVKEDIIIKRRIEQPSFEFRLDGAVVTGRPEKPSRDGARDLTGGLTLSGPLGKDMIVYPPSVHGPDGTPLPEAQPVLSGEASTVKVGLDPSWLAKRSDRSFPVVLDPTTANVTQTNSAIYRSSSTSSPFCWWSPPSSCTHATVGNHYNLAPSTGNEMWRTYWELYGPSIRYENIRDARLKWTTPTGVGTLPTSLYATFATAVTWNGLVNNTNPGEYKYCSNAVIYNGDGQCEVTSIVQAMFRDRDYLQFGLSGDEISNTLNAKDFTPVLEVTVNDDPVISGVSPTGDGVTPHITDSSAPVVQITASDTHSDPLAYRAEICDVTGGVSGACAFTPWSSYTTSSPYNLTLAAPAYVIQHNRTYTYRAEVTDGPVTISADPQVFRTTGLPAQPVSDQGNPSLGIIENRHGVGVLAGGG